MIIKTTMTLVGPEEARSILKGRLDMLTVPRDGEYIEIDEDIFTVTEVTHRPYDRIHLATVHVSCQMVCDSKDELDEVQERLTKVLPSFY